MRCVVLYKKYNKCLTNVYNKSITLGLPRLPRVVIIIPVASFSNNIINLLLNYLHLTTVL